MSGHARALVVLDHVYTRICRLSAHIRLCRYPACSSCAESRRPPLFHQLKVLAPGCQGVATHLDWIPALPYLHHTGPSPTPVLEGESRKIFKRQTGWTRCRNIEKFMGTAPEHWPGFVCSGSMVLAAHCRRQPLLLQDHRWPQLLRCLLS